MGRKAKSVVFESPRNPSRPTVEEFYRMVESHDPTYVWSFDAEVRAAGTEERRVVNSARLALGDELAVPIWNRMLRRKVVPSMIEEFLWWVGRP